MEKNVKKNYEEPFAELIEFRFQDLILASGESGGCVNHDRGHGGSCRVPNQNSNSKKAGC